MNPYNYLQYQSKAEPLREIYPNQLDKWAPRLSQPQPRRPFPTAILVSACSLVPVVAESVTLEKWYQRPSQPILTRSPLRIYETILNPQILREGPITLDKWWKPTQQPYLKVKRPIQEGGIFFFDWAPFEEEDESEYLDRWWRQASIPVRGKPSLRIYEPVQNPQVLREGPIKLDKWEPRLSQPYLARSPLRIHEPVKNPQVLREGPITLDKWFQPTQQPYLIAKRPVSEGGCFFFNWEVLKVAAGSEQYPDRWWQPASIPVWSRPPLRIYEPVQNPQILREGPTRLDKWWQPTQQPYLRTPSLRQSQWVAFVIYVAPEVVSLDKWWQPTSLPPALFLVRPLRIQYESNPHILREGSITLDKWWMPASEPVRVKPPLRLCEWFSPVPHFWIEYVCKEYLWLDIIYVNPEIFDLDLSIIETVDIDLERIIQFELMDEDE